MLPGVRHRSQRCSRLWKSFKTTGMCSRRHGEVVLEVRRLQKTDISSYQQKGTGAPQLSRWQISFLLPQESRSPEKTVARRLRGGGGLYVRRSVVCVPLTRQQCVVCNGVVSITIGLNRTGHAYYSQMRDCLDSEGIQRLVWPASSPDLNPIENVWDALGRQVAGRNYPPINKNTLIRALTEEWDKLPQRLLDNVVQSMVRRVECCITLRGGHIPY
ncbi:DDE_3 domain-containing protein [Trichonephila clavipes]|uniref:DDE_3 domain-containing protein n=1 Tax=Trichonephila clavipes TaxID=2585209 RepID=A0A8X6V376_TRICX|nr:DDE_3 domain-containing protein [Trichonephila clavipes]